MLAEKYQNVKQWIGENKKDLFIALILVLMALISFGLGRLSVVHEKYPVRIEENPPGHSSGNLNANKAVESGKYVASKNSSVYHLPNCPGAKRINNENKVWFSSAEEALALGFRAAKNCPGL